MEESAQERLRGRSPSPCSAGWGEVSVVEKVVGYKKIKFFTHENAGYGDVRLPEMQMHTTAFWLTVPEERVRRRIRTGRAAAISGLARDSGGALETVATLALMCDPRDLGATLGEANPDGEHGAVAGRGTNREGCPSGAERAAWWWRSGRGRHAGVQSYPLFLYEHIPGGTGSGRADLRAARGAARTRAAAIDRELPVPRRVPVVRGARRRDGERADRARRSRSISWTTSRRFRAPKHTASGSGERSAPQRVISTSTATSFHGASSGVRAAGPDSRTMRAHSSSEIRRGPKAEASAASESISELGVSRP